MTGIQKKVLLIGLSVVLTLGLAGAAVCYWYFFLKPSKRAVAECLPASTLFYVTLPNASATLLKYQTSHLKQVMQSKEARDLGSLISGKAAASQKGLVSDQDAAEFKALMESLVKSLSGESFLAVTKVEPDAANPCEAIFGARPLQGAASLDDFVAKLKQISKRKQPMLQSGQGKKGKYSYEWWELASNKTRICYCKMEEWALITLGETALQDFIDRYFKPSSAGDSLGKQVSFQEIQKRLGQNQDVLAFVNMETIAAKLAAAIEKQGAGGGPQSAKAVREAYKPWVAFGMGARFLDHNLIDRWVLLSPKDKRPDLGASYKPCAFQTISFTSSDTLFYGAFNFDLRKQFDYLRSLYGNGVPEAAQAMDQAGAALANMKLDLNKNILDALGPEVSFQLDWPAQADFPEVVLLLQIAKKDDFKPTAAVLTQMIKGMGTTIGKVSETKVEQNDLLILAVPSVPQISPTLLLNDHFMGLFLTQEGARRILTKPASNTLSADATFQSLAASRKAGSTTLFYAHTPRLLEKTYAAAKLAVQHFGALVPPLQEALGKEPLPEKLSFADACGPWLMVTKVDDQAIECESVSGVGNLIVPASFAAGLGAAIAVPAFEKSRMQAMAAQKAAEAEKAEKEKSPQAVLKDLQELRVVIESWSKNQSVAKGTPVPWDQLRGSLIPGTSLEQSKGMDRLGNPYVLGVVGESLADVSPATKSHFAGAVSPDFWPPTGAQPKGQDKKPDPSAGNAEKDKPPPTLKEIGSTDEGLDKFRENTGAAGGGAVTNQPPDVKEKVPHDEGLDKFQEK